MNNMQNYKYLLTAIFNSDKFVENRKKTFVVVYDTYSSELPIGLFENAISCAKFFKTEPKEIRRNISDKSLRQDRFKIERVKIN